MDIKKTVGTRINAALARRNMLQKDLAKALGVTDNTISYYCKGARGPQLEQLPKIAEVLNTTTDYLLGISDDPSIQKSAVDDLGLSPEATDTIIRIRDQNVANLSDSLDKLITSPHFLSFLLKMSQYTDAVHSEISYFQDNEAHKWEKLPGMFGILLAEQALTERLTSELEEAYPDLKKRITVICGSDLIAQRMEALKTSLETLAHDAAGAFELDKLRIESGW